MKYPTLKTVVRLYLRGRTTNLRTLFNTLPAPKTKDESVVYSTIQQFMALGPYQNPEDLVEKLIIWKHHI